MKTKRFYRRNSRSGIGAALVIVLAFIVLLTAVMVIFFTQALSYRMQGNSSFNDFKSSALAQSGLETVVGDLQQEITNGSTAVTYVNGANVNYVYYPTGNTNAVPQRSGNPLLITNGSYGIP
jgi:Tfp pilus assembly protein PilX